MDNNSHNSLSVHQIHQLIDELRSAYDDLLSGNSPSARERAREAISLYNHSVLPDLDRRIAACHSLLRRGLRDEALGYATEEPDLFDAASAVDLERFGRKRRDEWHEIGKANGLVAPTMPNFDKLGDLVDARETLRALAPLLDEWRRLNVKRAPISARIDVLRRLVERDSGSPLWHTMLAEHEQYHLTALTAAAKEVLDAARSLHPQEAAATAQNVASILADLQSEWTTLVPPLDLTDRLQKLLRAAQAIEHQQRLVQLADEIETWASRLADDRTIAKSRLRDLWEAWQRTVEEGEVETSAEEQLARVAPILRYVKDTRDYEAYLVELQHSVTTPPAALKRRITWVESLEQMLDRLDDAASRLPEVDVNRRLHAELENRVSHISDAVGREVRFRQVVIAASAVAVVLIVAVMIGGYAVVQRYEAEIATAIAAADMHRTRIEAGEDLPLEALTAGWRDDIRADPRVAGVLEQVEHATEQMAARRSHLNQLREELQNSIAALRGMNIDDPLAPWPAEFTAATRALTRIRDEALAVTTSEQAITADASKELSAVSRGFLGRAENAFVAEVRGLEQELALVRLDWPRDIEEADKLIAEAQTRLTVLRRTAETPACPAASEGFGNLVVVPAASAGLVSSDSRIAQTLGSLRSRRSALATLAKREDDADTLLTGRRFAEYADALRAIAGKLGAAPVAREYAQAAGHLSAWQAMDQWQSFVESLTPPAQMTPQEAKKYLDALTALEPKTQTVPDAVAALPWLKLWLTKLSSQTDDASRSLTLAVKRILQSAFGTDIDAMVKPKDGSFPRYYCLKTDRPSPDFLKPFSFVTDLPDATRAWPKARSPRTLTDNPESWVVSDSPQKLLATRGLAVLENAALSPQLLEELAGEILVETSVLSNADTSGNGVDPILHAILLRWLLVIIAEKVPEVAEAFTQSLSIVNAGKAPDGQDIILKGVENDTFRAALNPERQQGVAFVTEDRRMCAAFIETLRQEALRFRTRSREQRDEIISRYRTLDRYKLAGRLQKVSDTEVGISGGSAALRRNAQLFAIGGPSQNYRLITFATCDDAGQIPPGTKVDLPAGEPVYVRQAPEKTTKKNPENTAK